MKNRVKKLQDLAQAKRAEEFIEELARLATDQDCSGLLEELRTRRVLLRFRDSSIVARVRQRLQTALRPSLPMDQWQRLDHLCHISHRLQCMLDVFDREANAVPSFAAPTSGFQTAVLYELDRRVEEAGNTCGDRSRQLR